MRLLLLLILTALLTTLSAQTILLEDFEDATVTYVTSTPEFSDGSRDYFTRTDGSNISSAMSFTNVDGFFFAAQDIDGEGALATQSLTFSNIDITGETILNFSIDLAEDDDGTNEDWDDNDFFEITYTIDGGSPVNLLFVNSSGTGTNNAPAIDDDFDGLGEGAEITDAFTTFVRTIAVSGSTLELTITMNLDSGDEDIAFDNVTLEVPASDGVCGVVPDVGSITSQCLTTTNQVDEIEVSISYTGVEPGFIYTITPAAERITGDDPATNVDGTISFVVLEGTVYTVSFGSTDCTTIPAVPLTFVDGTCAGAPVPDVAINEFLADPDSDVNGDGTLNTSEDEFLEVYNFGNTDVDISGYTISDAVRVRHTFPAGTVLEPGQGVVVYGSIVPVNPCQQSATDGELGLNNSGDNITLSSANGDLVDEVNYAGSTNDVSLAREVDGTGNFVAHTSIASNPVNYSPCVSNTDATVSLPVDLTSFTGALTPKAEVDLFWTTAREENARCFDLERSADGRTFRPLTRLEATNLATGADYTFRDQTAPAGPNYYRLRQVDFDGQSVVYGPVLVRVTAGELTAFPNPVADQLTVRGAAEAATLTVFDLQGRQIDVPVTEAGVSVANLRPGTYLLRVTEANQTRTLRFVRR